MGNWRTVHVTGKCSPDDLPALQAALDMSGDYDDRDYDKNGPLAIYGGLSLCGINDWPAVEMDVVGNLAERDYSVEDVAEHLRKLVPVAPSLLLRIDCGGEYESEDCVATIIVGEDRQVHVLPPQAEKVGPIPVGQMQANLIEALRR